MEVLTVTLWDNLPPRLKAYLLRHYSGATIHVPKRASPQERRSRNDRIRAAYRNSIAAGGAPSRVVAGLAMEFQVSERWVYRIVGTEVPGTGFSGQEP